MEKISFHVAEFDAPLDLILHLISKHKLNILDIDISSLLDQYMSYIQTLQQQSMDISSEFLEMASRLVYMKTVSLLPKHEEESEELRRGLTGELMEYRLCKLAASLLGDQNLSLDLFIRDPAPVEIDPTYRHTHPAGILYSALNDALGRGARRQPPPRESFAPLVARPVVSVTSKIFTVLRLLRKSGRVSFDRLFDSQMGRSGLVATFLAVLELVKTKKICVDENGVQII